MIKKIFRTIVAVVLSTIVMGATVMAAPSPAASTAIIAALAGDGDTTSVGSFKLGADYTDAEDKTLTLVAEEILEEEYVIADPEVYVIWAFKLSLMDYNGNIFVGDNGTYGINVGVGNEYDGMTLTVYVVYSDNSVVAYQGVVTRGKLTIDGMSVTGSVSVYVTL